ncbi:MULTISPECIES: bh protein [unclassified Sporolactobacillus]|uniref:bh protein n=1 Tax=unclassified Sporolactobacillus TaxID=2628533 RepID=UPI0023678C7D|nr:bh protein [Sporolactobacillus sp. CQH2019]MDD9148915.1 bh protein [Sporolactobacillus sp. CQH2019]
MKKHEVEADLFCTNCDRETAHKIVYINDQIAQIECEQCHQAINMEIDVVKEFYKELYQKIATKPTRITQEYRQDLSAFLRKLPFRVISKPYRVIKELNESRKIIEQYRQKNDGVK